MRIISVIFLFITTFSFSQNYHGKRTALVIGNSTYNNAPLANPKNDAIAMSSTLKGLGFEVLSYTDITRTEMREAILEFGEKLVEKKGLGLFYFAGHGLQYQGRNYLVPIDADIRKAFEIEDQCVRADLVLRMMEQYDNPMNIVILDACRNNPYIRSFRDMNQGLAKTENAPVGSLIAYATAPGSVAADGDGENGLYTQELINAIKEPGLSIEQIFKKVRNQVLAKTNEEQIPWESSSLRGDFFFIEPQIDDVEIQSLAMSSLYLNCGNVLNVQIPELGDSYNPTFEVQGAIILKGQKTGLITIVPKELKVTLTIKNNGKIITTRQFYVKPIPLPKISLSSNGEMLNMKRGMKIDEFDTITWRILADKTFRLMLPKDARYRVSKLEINLVRGGRAVKSETINNVFIEDFSLKPFMKLAKPNDILNISFLEVKRRNFQDKIEIVSGFPINSFNIPLY